MVVALAGHTAFAIATGRAGPLAGGASEPWCAHTVAVLGDTSATILAGTGIAAVGSPKALWAGQVATCAHPASLTSAVSMNRVTALGVVTVTDTGTTFTKLSLRARKLAVNPTPPRGASTGSSLGAADSLVGTLATGIATEAPGARGTGHRAVTTLPTFLADARAVDGRAGNGIFTGAAGGTVDPVSVRWAKVSAVRSRVAGCAPAEAAVSEANTAVQTEAVLLAAGSVRVLRAALVAVEARPTWLAGALAVHWVAAETVFWVAGAGILAAQTIAAIWTESLSAAVACEAMFAQTRTIGRKATSARSTVTGLSTVVTEAAHRALFTAPIPDIARSTVALPSKPVTKATIVATTFLSTVGSVETLWAWQGTDDTHPARWAAAGALKALRNTSILARISSGAEEAISAL